MGVVTWGKTWVLAQMKTTGRASGGKEDVTTGWQDSERGAVILKSCFFKDTVYKL